MSSKEKPPTLTEIQDGVESSGFPLQFAVAKRLLELGYEVHPSARFLNRTKHRESEVDVLALKRHSLETQSGIHVNVTWRLVVEVKDSQFPFVLFGLAATPTSSPGMLHPDAFYSHIQTTRDRGIRNRFGIPAIDPDYNRGWSRNQHHQLSAVPRFYLATTFERTKDGNKLHVPEKLWSALATLGAYIDHVAEHWIAFSKQPDAEQMAGGHLQIFLNFAVLVHRGPHYRFGADTNDLEAASLSSVFLTHTADDVNISYVVDFVEFDQLAKSIVTIEHTAEALLSGFVGTILRSG